MGSFEKESLKKLEELFQTKQHAVLVGGSGLYIDAVCKGFDNFPDIKPESKRENKNKLQQQRPCLATTRSTKKRPRILPNSRHTKRTPTTSLP